MKTHELASLLTGLPDYRNVLVEIEFGIYKKIEYIFFDLKSNSYVIKIEEDAKH